MLNAPKASTDETITAATRALEKKNYDDAEFTLQEFLSREPANHAALGLLADTYALQGRMDDAIAYCMMAVKANPSELRYKENFVQWAGEKPVGKYDPLIEFVVTECLKSAQHFDCTMLHGVWATHLMLTPGFHETYGQQMVKMNVFDPANAVFFERIANFKPLFTPYFLLGLRHITVFSPVFEEFITHLRRHLINDNGQKFTPAEATALAAAISHYNLRNDYILDVTKEEQEKAEALKPRIEDGKADAAAIALYACYEPLYILKNKDSLNAPEIADVIDVQITQYNTLQQTAKDIIAITPIDDAVSAKVREQYETFPYPRWASFSQNILRRGWRTTGRNEEIEGPLVDKKIKILIAGCGTGKQAVQFATVFPKAEILAVDLSRSSLAYAINKAKEYNITNVTFRQADILHLDTLNEQFDYVVCVGVLHHMHDPMKGWKILYNLLKPGGLMRIGLYSTLARTSVTRTRAVIAEKGYAHDAEGMRKFRRESPRFLDVPVIDEIYRLVDYYNLSMYRDLIFHVQEHTYTLLQIDRMLKELGIKFISFFHPSVLNLYFRTYPSDRKAVNLEQWHRLEEQNPTMFKGMYIFWCRK